MIERWQKPSPPAWAVRWLAPALLASSGFAALGCVGEVADPDTSTGRLSLSIVDDATGEATAVRLRLTDAAGDLAGEYPREAIDVVFGWEDPDKQRDTRRQGDGAFYVYGDLDMELEPGTYELFVSKGHEYLQQEHELVIEAGEELSKPLRMKRWVDMPARGWFSADGHVHIRRSPSEDPMILTWMAAEDVHVGALLQMGDPEGLKFAQYAWGQDGVYEWEDYFLTSGQEDPRTHNLGHSIALGATEFVRFPENYWAYDRVFDRVRELGGVSGYAHQGVMFYGYRGMTLDILRNRVDFVEILQFCEEGDPLRTEHYYHFLDLGFRLTATAGSDFPWCGQALVPQIGEARFYTYIDGELGFESWREGLRAGHTFVSSGPMVELAIDDAIPGDTLKVDEGSTLVVRAAASGHAGQTPLESLEIVAHGEVIASATPSERGQSTDRLTLEIELPVQHGLWIAARTRARPKQAAHTTPIYVTVGDSGFHNPATVAHRLDVSERILDEIEREVVGSEDDKYRRAPDLRVEQTRRLIANLRLLLLERP